MARNVSRRSILVATASIPWANRLSMLSGGDAVTLARAARATADGIALGIWQPGIRSDPARLTEVERIIDRKIVLVVWYQDWAGDAELDLECLIAVAARGSVAMITWQPSNFYLGVDQSDYSLGEIASGRFDELARSWGERLAAFGKPVLLRWASEMNGDWYSWGANTNGNTPKQYVAAWRRLRLIFHRAGATNVQWVWAPDASACDPVPFFPGDAYVDWIGLDGFNWGASIGWKSFSEIFAASYARLTAISGRPFLISETASAEQGGDKAAWIEDALAVQVPHNFPRVRAVVWFNENKERDWRIDSSMAAAQAFAHALRTGPYLKAGPDL
jgi:glycosyl hydrolase family 26